MSDFLFTNLFLNRQTGKRTIRAKPTAPQGSSSVISRERSGGADFGISDFRISIWTFCSEIPTASPSTCNLRVRGEWQTRTARLRSRLVPQLAGAADPA